jgi:hypothetical protein
MRHELEAALRLARDLNRDELPKLLGELEEVRATAQARLATPPAPAQPDQWVGIEEAAAMLSVSTDYLYHNHERYPFVRRMGKRLLFSQAGIEKYTKTVKVA